MLQFTDQTPGNLIVVLHNGAVIGSAVFSEAEARPAPADVVRAIEAQSWADGPPRTEKLGSLGFYRLNSHADGSDVLIAGVSLNLADRIIARKQVTTTPAHRGGFGGHRRAHRLGRRLHPSTVAPAGRYRGGSRRHAAYRRRPPDQRPGAA